MDKAAKLRADWAAFETRARQITWRHLDDSVCPETLNDRLTTDGGELWWCTTHQQHLQGTPNNDSLPVQPLAPYVDPLIAAPSDPFAQQPLSYLEQRRYQLRDCNKLGPCAQYGIEPCDCYH